MFHQVFICDSTEDPDCLTNLVPEQNSLDDAAQVFKEEQNSSENSVVGCDQTEDLKIPVEELKSEKCRVVSNQIVLTTDTPVATKLDLESDSFVNVTESCSNLATKTEETFVLPSTSADTVDPLQIPLGRSLGQIIVQQPLSADTKPTFVHPPSVDNSDLQIKPSIETLLGANDTAVKFLPGTLVDPVTQMMGLSPGAPTQEPLLKTLKLEPTTTLDSEADIKTSQEQLTSELSDADMDDSLIMIKREGIVSEDQHLDLAKSEVQNAVVICQEGRPNEHDDYSKILHRIKCTESSSNGAYFSSSTSTTNTETKQHQSIFELQNYSEDKRENTYKHESIMRECKVVLLNKSHFEHIIPDFIEDNNLENKTALDIDEESTSRNEENREVGNCSGSDWEEEYLNDLLESRPKSNIITEKRVNLSTEKSDLNIYLNYKLTNENPESFSAKEEINISTILFGTKNNTSTQISTTPPSTTNYCVSNRLVTHERSCANTSIGGLLMQNRNLIKSGNHQMTTNNTTCESTELKDHSDGRSKAKKNISIRIHPISDHKNERNPTKNSSLKPESICEQNIQLSPAGIKIRKTHKVSSKLSDSDNEKESESDLSQSPLFNYKCDKCGKFYEKFIQYQNHERYSSCHGFRRKASHPCRICDKRFTSRYKRDDHENSHTNARPFKCLECDKHFNSRHARQLHHSNTHLSQKSWFLCCFCGYLSRNCKHLLAHEDSHRLPEGEEIPKPFNCSVCAKGFISLYKLNQHRKEHRLKKCMTCSEKFKTRAQRRKHMESAHNIVKPCNFVCEKCGKQFKSSWSLEIHQKDHGAVLSYFCDLCDKGFKRKGNLAQHMITHSNERPISCSECGVTFKRMTHLKQHVAAAHGDGTKT